MATPLGSASYSSVSSLLFFLISALTSAQGTGGGA